MTDQLEYGKHNPVFEMARKYQQCLEENERLKAKLQDLKTVYEELKQSGIQHDWQPDRYPPATEKQMQDLWQAVQAICEENKNGK